MNWCCKKPGHWLGYHRNTCPVGRWAPEILVCEGRRGRTTGNAPTWLWRVDPVLGRCDAGSFRTLRQARAFVEAGGPPF